jgi:DHA1 family inner membrane transport protein
MEQKNKLKLNSGGLLVFILTVGVFGIINTEMGVVGILPLIAETFNVSVPQAGWTVSVFALVVAASAPVTPLLFSGINRKKVMLLVLGLFTLSNIISMLTSNFTILLIARILPAFLHPVYVSMAFTVAAASVSKEQAPKAVSKVFIGVSAGMVLGVPVTSFIASEVSFSMAMLFFTVVNALVFVATMLFIPSVPVKEKVSYGAQLSVLKKTEMWHSIIAVTLINGAMFGFFSYMSDYLKTVTEVSYNVISAVLLVYGLANIVGNVLAGRLLSINARRSIIIMPFALLASYIFLFFVGEWITAMVIIILILGVLAGIASNNMQYMITDSAPDFANGMFLTSANLGTTIGTAICGAFITEMGTRYSVFGAFLFLIASIVFVYLRVRMPHSRKQVKMEILAE